MPQSSPSIKLRGFDLLNQPLLNKGTAFTEAERDAFDLHGLLPPHVGRLDDQVNRRLNALRRFATDFERYAFLRELQDTNETLFYALLVRHIEELLPLVYTPTVGEGCQRFSEIWRKPRGLFLSYPNRHRIRDILANRAILIGCASLSSAMASAFSAWAIRAPAAWGFPLASLPSIPPARVFIRLRPCRSCSMSAPTIRSFSLNPLYVGWRHDAYAANKYDAFVDDFVSAVDARWPDVLLQWEDFAGANAARLLERYRDRLCTFNDDIQGTAAMAAGTLLAAIKVTGIPFTKQRIVSWGGVPRAAASPPY